MIYYLCPNDDNPVGGILVLARHVELLGDRATLVVEKPFDLWWVVPKPQIRTITLDELSVGPDDTIVVPECRWRWTEDYITAGRRILFNQNLAYFEEFGSATEVMVCGMFLYTLMKHKTDLPVHLASPFFYREPWAGESSGRPYKLIFIDRRGTREAIDYIVEKMDLGPREYTIVSGLPQDKLAEKLRQSRIYVHLTYPDGFALPVPEAWLCGAAVVGYAGGGALEFMLHGHNSLIANDGDADAVLEYIREAISGDWAGLAHNGRRAALRYNRDLTMQQLERIYGN